MQGVIGVYSLDNATQKALNILYGVQHRGQESAGISAAGNHSIRTWKGTGLVSKVFDEHFKSFMHPDDYVAIGCASGESINQGKIPPVELESDSYKLSVALDGYIFDRGHKLNEEILGSLILNKMNAYGLIETAMTEAIKDLPNAYFSAVITLLDKETCSSELIAARDPRGIRPLYLGLNDDELFVTSESAPIDVMENMGERIDEKRDLIPGALIRKNDEGFMEKQLLEPKNSHCAFEWVYYGRPDSVIEGRTVHNVRKRLGKALVETHSLKELYGTNNGSQSDMVVIPIPDSGRSVCIGVTEALGIQTEEGVIKNAYLGRTYIIDDPKFRKIASDLKHNIIRETVQKKKVVITDDSIVRGTVSESVAQNLLNAGAAEVEFLVSYAPIYYPCFSDPEDKPLAAAPYKGRSLEEVGELIASTLPSINKVRYNSPENVIESIGLPGDTICALCITGRDPFKRGESQVRLQSTSSPES